MNRDSNNRPSTNSVDNRETGDSAVQAFLDLLARLIAREHLRRTHEGKGSGRREGKERGRSHAVHGRKRRPRQP